MTFRFGIAVERGLTQAMEMQKSCEFLYKIREYQPVIAGGALWSWAAGRRPNDIDVFVGDYNGIARSAFSMVYEENNQGSDSLAEKPNTPAYRNIAGNELYDIYRFKHKIEVGDQTVGARGYVVPIDLVCTPWNGEGPIWHFDYNHCMVAFGANTRNLFGAEFYVKGLLQTRHDKPRPMERIRGKLQKDLWGNPDALPRLQMVMEQLDWIYKTIASPPPAEVQQ